MLNILGQLHGAEVNNNIVNSAIVNDKQYSEEIPSALGSVFGICNELLIAGIHVAAVFAEFQQHINV